MAIQDLWTAVRAYLRAMPHCCFADDRGHNCCNGLATWLDANGDEWCDEHHGAHGGCTVQGTPISDEEAPWSSELRALKAAFDAATPPAEGPLDNQVGLDRAVAHLRAMGGEEFRRSLVRAGTHTPDGKLVPALRGAIETAHVSSDAEAAEYAPITHVAIRFLGRVWALPAPNRHHDVIRHIVQQTGISHVDAYEDDQGFLDANGRYLRRKPALARALLLGQVKDPAQVRAERLFSEDLW